MKGKTLKANFNKSFVSTLRKYKSEPCKDATLVSVGK